MSFVVCDFVSVYFPIQHMLNQTKRCVETQTGETEDDVDDEDDDEDEVEENDGDGDEDDDDDITNKSLVDDGGGVILNDVIEDMVIAQFWERKISVIARSHFCGRGHCNDSRVP